MEHYRRLLVHSNGGLRGLLHYREEVFENQIDPLHAFLNHFYIFALSSKVRRVSDRLECISNLVIELCNFRYFSQTPLTSRG